MVIPSVRATIPLLREIKLLRRFGEAELGKLLQIGRVLTHEPHANIVIEGEPSWGLYLILDGMVGVYKRNKLSGDVHDVAQLRAGQFFGEMSLVDENPRSATVKALTPCQTFHLSKDDFLRFLSQSQELRARFYESCVQDLVNRLRELDENYVISQYQLWKAAVSGEAA
jgi:CRP-like cAMP-binding protein